MTIDRLGRRRVGEVRLKACCGIGVQNLGFVIVASDVFDPAIANCYHVIILKCVPLDLAAIDQGAVCTTEIYKFDTD